MIKIEDEPQPLVVRPILFPDHSAAAKAAEAADAAKAAAVAEAAQKAAQAAQATQHTTYAPAPVITAPTQSEAWYKAWIYNEESGNNPTRYNSIGCLGLGQACPGSKLLAVCPTMDYSCEDNFFTSYMLSRYGSWYNAYEFHLARNWW